MNCPSCGVREPDECTCTQEERRKGFEVSKAEAWAVEQQAIEKEIGALRATLEAMSEDYVEWLKILAATVATQVNLYEKRRLDGTPRSEATLYLLMELKSALAREPALP